MGAAAAVLGGAGALTGIVGAGFQMDAEAKATAAKVQEDKVNQQLQLGMAGSVLQRGAWEAQQSLLKGDQVAGQARADFAASGVDANSGSAAAIQAQSKAMAGLDATQAQNNAARQAWGYQVTANQYGAQQGIDKELGQDQEIGTALGAAGGALGAGGGLLGKAGPGSASGGVGFGG